MLFAALSALCESAAIDQRLNAMRKKYPTAGSRLLELAAAAEPDERHASHLEWIVRQAVAEDVRLEEDGERLKTALLAFDRLTRRLRDQLEPADRNLMNYRRLGDIEQKIEEWSGRTTKGAALKTRKAEGSRVVFEGDGWQIVEIANAEAAKAHCAGSSWCVKDPKFASGYLKDGPLYLIARGGQNVALAHPASGALKDPHDRRITDFKLAGELVELLKKAGLYTANGDMLGVEALSKMRGRLPELSGMSIEQQRAALQKAAHEAVKNEDIHQALSILYAVRKGHSWTQDMLRILQPLLTKHAKLYHQYRMGNVLPFEPGEWHGLDKHDMFDPTIRRILSGHPTTANLLLTHWAHDRYANLDDARDDIKQLVDRVIEDPMESAELLHLITQPWVHGYFSGTHIIDPAQRARLMQSVLSDPRSILEYVKRHRYSARGKVMDMEAFTKTIPRETMERIERNPRTAAEFANVTGGRPPADVEKRIVLNSTPRELLQYTMQTVKRPWDEQTENGRIALRRLYQASDPNIPLQYLLNHKLRSPEFERIFESKVAELARKHKRYGDSGLQQNLMQYMRQFMPGGRWPAGEKYLIKHPYYSYKHAHETIKGRWEEAEPRIAKHARSAYRYARNVIKGRWPLGEPAILKSKDFGDIYRRKHGLEAGK